MNVQLNDMTAHQRLRTAILTPSFAASNRIRSDAAVDIDAALDLCERITVSQAPSLYAAIEPLPTYRRRAVCVICAFVHRLGEIANAELPPVNKVELLADARRGIPRPGATRQPDPVLVALRDTHRRFALPLDSFDDLIDGLTAIAGKAGGARGEDLLMQRSLIGGSVGRLAVAVLGNGNPAAAAARADDLATAICLTETLHDLLARHQSGRRVRALYGDWLRRARESFDRGLALIPVLDARGAAFVTALASGYERLLDNAQALLEG
jgi:15-cis-phytoene synthase